MGLLRRVGVLPFEDLEDGAVAAARQHERSIGHEPRRDQRGAVARDEGVQRGLAATARTVDGDDDLASHGVGMILDGAMASRFRVRVPTRLGRASP